MRGRAQRAGVMLLMNPIKKKKKIVAGDQIKLLLVQRLWHSGAAFSPINVGLKKYNKTPPSIY